MDIAVSNTLIIYIS